MASRWINAILWTLVGVNLITLVLGGLITWLAHTIPIRLKQFGLSPEITQAAGFASLLVACLGLCALNYSSHYALNAYGLSCSVLLVLTLFGVLPESWQRALHGDSGGPSSSTDHHQPALASAGNLSRPSSASGGGGGGGQAPLANQSTSLTQSRQQQQQQQAQQQQHQQQHHGGLLLDMIHFALLLLLASLLSIAFILAQHLRQKQRRAAQFEEEEEAAAAAAQDESARNFAAADFSRRVAMGPSSFDCGTPSCTCSLGGQVGAQVARGSGSGGGVLQHTTMGGQTNHQAAAAAAAYATQAAAAANNGALPPHADDIQVMRGMPARWPPRLSNADHGGGGMERFLPPLVPRGIYRAPATEAAAQDDDNDDDDERQEVGEGSERQRPNPQTSRGPRGRHCQRAREPMRPASSLSQQTTLSGSNNNRDIGNHMAGAADNRCRCEGDACYKSSRRQQQGDKMAGPAAALAAKLNVHGAPSNNMASSHPGPNYNTMPSNLGHLSSVYAIKSALALAGAQRRALEATRRKKAAAKAASGGSMMAMTAAAAAALFGGVVDSSSMMDHHAGGSGGLGADLVDTTNLDAGDGGGGLQGLDDNFAEALMNYHQAQDPGGGGGGYDFAGNNHHQQQQQQHQDAYSLPAYMASHSLSAAAHRELAGPGAFDFGVY